MLVVASAVSLVSTAAVRCALNLDVLVYLTFFVDMVVVYPAVALGELFPDKLTLALEIRAKVTEYVRLRIEALRAEQPGQVGC